MHIQARYFLNLRADVCKYRKWADSCQNSDFLIFCPKDPYGEWFSKIAPKVSAELYFFQNREKFGKRHFCLRPPPFWGRKSYIFTLLSRINEKRSNYVHDIYQRTSIQLSENLYYFEKLGNWNKFQLTWCTRPGKHQQTV